MSSSSTERVAPSHDTSVTEPADATLAIAGLPTVTVALATLFPDA